MVKEKILDFAKKIEAKISIFDSNSYTVENIKKLLEGESIEIGYRATCGNKTDDTLKSYRLFIKI